MLTYLIEGILLALVGAIVDWQKAKSSLKEAIQKNWLKYLIVIAAVVFYGLLPTSLLALGIGALAYLFSDLVKGFFVGLYNKFFKKS